MEQTPEGNGKSTEPVQVQELFRKHSQVPDVTLGDGALQGQELESMIWRIPPNSAHFMIFFC